MMDTDTGTFDLSAIEASRPNRLLPVLGLLLLLAFAIFLLWQVPRTDQASPLRTVYDQGDLIVLTRNAPGIYQVSDAGITGFDYELVQSFARFLGKRTHFVSYDTTSEILDALHFNQGHLAAASLVRSPNREGSLIFGPEFRTAQQVVVGPARGMRIREMDDLLRMRILVRAMSGQEERLAEIKALVPKLKWRSLDQATPDQLLKAIRRRETDVVVMDSTTANMQLRIHPEYKVLFALTKEEPVAWPMALEAHFLQPKLEEWACSIEASGELEQLRDRYYGFMGDLPRMDLNAYKRAIRNELPALEPLFREAAEASSLNWTLLAAVSYQESQWNLEAVSHTGVRGLMMLTEQTARELGVVDRSDPRESILGGSRYLASLRDRLPASIHEPDRSWFALAAYNVGLGHVADARALAKQAKRDPNRWVEVRKFLPLLSDPIVAARLRYGLARGREPVDFVQNVRDLYQILERRSSKGKSTARLF